MREAEREAHLLESRIIAWQRLEMDALKKVDRLSEPLPFEPSRCSVCANPIAWHLLNLWLSLLEADPDKVIITPEMVRALLAEDSYMTHGFKPLSEAKRHAVKQIALLSKQGAEVVLRSMKERFQATESVACAEILGKIVETPGSPPAFFELAMEVLNRSTAADIP